MVEEVHWCDFFVVPGKYTLRPATGMRFEVSLESLVFLSSSYSNDSW